MSYSAVIWIDGALRWGRVYLDCSIAEVVAHARRAASGLYGRRDYATNAPVVRLVIRDPQERVVARHSYRGAGRSHRQEIVK